MLPTVEQEKFCKKFLLLNRPKKMTKPDSDRKIEILSIDGGTPFSPETFLPVTFLPVTFFPK